MRRQGLRYRLYALLWAAWAAFLSLTLPRVQSQTLPDSATGAGRFAALSELEKRGGAAMATLADAREEAEVLRKKVPDEGEWVQLHHANGALSSEGYLVEGEPEGWWRSYDAQGRLSSEGFRENHRLSGLWTFYENGVKKSEILYRQDLKQGAAVHYTPGGFKVEFYEKDLLHGLRSHYDTAGVLLKTEPFFKGERHGLVKKFSPSTGLVIQTQTYKNGILTKQEDLNRRGPAGRRQGLWKDFYPNDRVAWEVPYTDDKKNGYYKAYDTSGNIVKIEKYRMGVLEEDAPELSKIEIYTEYYADGRPKLKAGYKNGRLEGICREYDSATGKVLRGTLFKNGEVVGGGTIDDNGRFQDDWKEYYPNGVLRCKGTFKRGKKQEHWVYYYEDGAVEQEGDFAQGRYEGRWIWYYPNGSVRLQQDYHRGLPDGVSEEYSPSGVCVVKGRYIEGLEEGEWVYIQGEERTEGRYKNGERSGLWKSYWYEKGNALSFRGNFVDGQPHGVHYHYWDNGNLREENRYNMGRRVGHWTKYDENGDILVRVQYNGEEEEVKYNGKRTLTRSEEAEDPDEYYQLRRGSASRDTPERDTP